MKLESEGSLYGFFFEWCQPINNTCVIKVIDFSHICIHVR